MATFRISRLSLHRHIDTLLRRLRKLFTNYPEMETVYNARAAANIYGRVPYRVGIAIRLHAVTRPCRSCRCNVNATVGVESRGQYDRQTV